MKKIEWLIEPETGDRYVLDEDPTERLLPLDRYKTIRPYQPITVWRQWLGKRSEFGTPDATNDPRWDSTLIRRFGNEYTVNSVLHPDSPVPISAALLQMGKSYARTNGNTRTIGLPGVMFWAEWPRIAPCWVVISSTEAYKLLTEEQAGLSREEGEARIKQ